MSNTDFKRADAIIDHYVKVYKDKYGNFPVVNRNKNKFDVISMNKDVRNLTLVRDIVSYYIKSYRNPSLHELTNKYDEILQEMLSDAEDNEQKKILLKETQNSVRDFRNRFGAQ